MWKSMRRGPMLQPPGMAIVARPRRATIGPITMMLARMRRTSSYGARSFSAPRGVDAQLAVVEVHLGAQRAQHLDHGEHVGDARHAADGRRLVGQQAGGHELEGRVLGAGQDDLALEPAAAAHEQRAPLPVRPRPRQGRLASSPVVWAVVAAAHARAATLSRFSAAQRLLGAEEVDLGVRARVAAQRQPVFGPLAGRLGPRHVDAGRPARPGRRRAAPCRTAPGRSRCRWRSAPSVPSGSCTRVSPIASSVTSGWCRGRMPSSPSTPGTTTMLASPS